MLRTHQAPSFRKHVPSSNVKITHRLFRKQLALSAKQAPTRWRGRFARRRGCRSIRRLCGHPLPGSPRGHLCTRTGLAPGHIYAMCQGLHSPLAHLRRDCARPWHTEPGPGADVRTELAPAPLRVWLSWNSRWWCRYHSSQPWPIGRGNACQLMLGCAARARTDTIMFDAREMEDVRLAGHRVASLRASRGTHGVARCTCATPGGDCCGMAGAGHRTP